MLMAYKKLILTLLNTFILYFISIYNRCRLKAGNINIFLTKGRSLWFNNKIIDDFYLKGLSLGCNPNLSYVYYLSTFAE